MRPTIQLTSLSAVNTPEIRSSELMAWRKRHGVSSARAVEASLNGETLEIYLHGIVGDDEAGSDAGTITGILASNRKRNVQMFVNSPGGLAYDGIAIFNAIQSHPGQTTGIIQGQAGSAASLAIMGCDVIKAHETSTFHPHYAMCMASGHKHEIMDTIKLLETIDSELEQLYAKRTGHPVEAIQQHLLGPHGDGTTFSARAAMQMRYVDEIIPTRSRPASQRPRTESADRLRALQRLQEMKKT